jgi:hypothetical protein
VDKSSIRVTAGGASIAVMLLERFTQQLATGRDLLSDLGVTASAFSLRVTAGGILVVVAASYIRDWLRRRSTISNPEALDQGVASVQQIHGRASDLRALSERVEEAAMIHLRGESGVGKSTLLTVGLMPALRDSAEVRGIYLDTFGRGDWDAAPRRALAKAVWRSLSVEERQFLGVAKEVAPEAVCSLLATLRDRGRMPVLVFDQFESYVRHHRSQFIGHNGKGWVSWDELRQRNPFWQELGALIAGDVVHVILCVNSADKAALRPFSPPGTEPFRLERLSKTVVAQRLAAITAAGFASDPDGGWNDLRARLVRDLTADGDVLGIRVTLALQGLLSLPYLTVADYLRVGGLPGLQAGFVLQCCETAARAARLHAASVLNVLLALAGHGRDESPALSLASVAAKTGTEPEALLAALANLETHRLVRRRIDPETDEDHWSLYHPYVKQDVKEAEVRLQRGLVLLRESYARYRHARNPWRRWLALLSPVDQWQLLWEAVRGRMRGTVYRRYIALSLTRWLPYALIPVAVLLAADSGWNFPAADPLRMQIDRYGASIFRKLYSEAQIRSSAQQLVGELRKELGSREQDGWATQKGSPSNGRNYWVHPQVVAAPARQSHVAAAALDTHITRLALMFDATFRDPDGVEVGWEEEANIGFARAEPMLWTGEAIALLLPKLPAADQRRARLTAWLDRVAVLAGHYVTPDGGWRRFPRNPTDRPSTYVTTLALMMLLESEDAGHKLTINGSSAEQLIQRAASWLTKNHDYSVTRPGWREYPDDPKLNVSKALTLQVYSTLSRAVAEMPRQVEASLSDTLVALLRSDFKRAVVERPAADDAADTFRANMSVRPDRDTIANVNVTFLWYPWAVEATRRGVVRAPQLGWSAAETARVCQNLGRLVVERGGGEVNDARMAGEFTFHAAELAFVLEALVSDQDWSECS